VLYRNNGDGTFADITLESGLGNLGFGSNVAIGDINSDGYVDIYLANSGFSDEDVGDSDVLYRNDGGNNHWLQVQLRGKTSNSMGIGARLKVSAGDLHQMREISGGRGYGQDSPIASFGLGEATIADTVEILWPSGAVEVLTDIAADQLISVEEGNPAAVQPYGRHILTWGKAKQDDGGFGADHTSVLGQNYPNPFNPETWIPYRLAESGEVVIAIHDSVGRLVRNLDIGYRELGTYISRDKAAHWDGKNDDGEYVSSGVYFYCIQAEGFSSTRKMLMLK